METLLSLCIGIALSAAAGFRLLVPFLALSIAAVFGHYPIGSDLQWVDSFPALEALAVGLMVEILAYYVPWVDHLLDTITFPASILAGILITAAFTSHLDPFMQWSLAIIAGGGAAAAAKTLAGGSRLTSLLTTGGFGNFVVATLELLAAIAVSVIAIVLPKVGLVLALVAIGALLWLGWRRWSSPSQVAA
jgi:hypothetical protein